MTEQRRVEPGTPLAYSEELLPGDGTYDDGEQIRAAVFGLEQVNPDTMVVSVRTAGKPVPEVKIGDIVVGRISFTKEDLASVTILEIEGKAGRTMLHQVEATLHVSKVDNKYIKDISNEMQVGDVVRAKVIGLRGGPQLATDRPEYGCLRCHSPEDARVALKKDGDLLVDPESGKKYRRKIAQAYGKGVPTDA